MAFPTVVDADTKNGTVTTNTTGWTLTYPTNLQAGDLILAFIGADGNSSSPSWPADWFAFHQGGGANTLTFAKKIATGSETGNFTVTFSTGEQGGWRVFRVTGWGGNIGAGFANIVGTSGDVVSSAVNTGTTANPDSINLDPANWATEDTLWFVAVSIDTSRTISVYPYAGRNTADVSGGSGGATLGICTTTSATSSLDAGTFTISASDDWAVATIAVRPAAASAPPPPFNRYLNQYLVH
jgi:hypothetical protein